MKKLLFLALFSMGVFNYLFAQTIAQMNVSASLSNINPQSGEVFDLNITVSSQALGDQSIITNAVVQFDLPAHLDIATMPATSSQYTITTSGNTSVSIQFNTPLPVGYTTNFLFKLKYESGVSVHDCADDTQAIHITANATNCLEGVFNTTTINPVNKSLPTIMEVATNAAGANFMHSTNIVLTGETALGGLNHNNAQVELSIDATATVYAIKLNNVLISPSSSTSAGKTIYSIPLTSLNVDEHKFITIYYHYPDNASCPASDKIYDLTVTYSADRKICGAYAAITPEVYTLQETIPCKPTGSEFIIPAVGNTFYKTANHDATRMNGQPQKYMIIFKPQIDSKDVLIIDNPALEAGFFDVNRFTLIEWDNIEPEIPTISDKIKTKISYELSNNLGTWVTIEPTPSYSGNSTPLPTGDASYVTQIKIEFFADDGVSTNLAAFAAGVRIDISATMTANSTLKSNGTDYDYIQDNLLNNYIYPQGQLIVNGNYETIPGGVSIASTTGLLNAAIYGYTDWGFSPLYWSLPGDATWNSWEIPFNNWMWGNTTLSGSLKVGDEFWFAGRFDLEVMPCKDVVYFFEIPDKYEILDLVAGGGIGVSRNDYPYEVFPMLSGVKIVKVTVNGMRYGGQTNCYCINWAQMPNNPLWAMYWQGNYTNYQGIGIKLRVLPGATDATFYACEGTTNFEQPFGNGVDAANWGHPNLWNSGAIAAGTGNYHVFASNSGSVVIDNTTGLFMQKTSSKDDVDYNPSTIVDNSSSPQTIYYKIHLENPPSGDAGNFDRIKIIDALPNTGDNMVLNQVSKGSSTVLTGVHIHEIIFTNANGNQYNITLPNDSIEIYYNTAGVSVQNSKKELADVSSTTVYDTWIWTDTVLPVTSIPNTAKAVKIDLKKGLKQSEKIDIIFQAIFPQGTTPAKTWNSFAVGAHSALLSTNLAAGEPAKSGISNLSGAYYISGMIWADANGDGIRQSSEQGVNGIVVELYDNNNVLLTSTFSGSDGVAGSYKFTGLDDTQLYFIKFDQDTFTVSPTGATADVTKDCDFVIINGKAMASRTINAANRENVDAGLNIPSDTLEVEVAICSSELPYYHGDSVFTAAGNKYVTFTASDGSDSVVHVILYVYLPATTIENITICSSQLPYNYRDTVFSVGSISGSYEFHRHTIHGCDSTHTLNLTINESKTTTATAAICLSQLPYTYHDTTFLAGTVSGTYIFHKSTSLGCDSTHSLQLTVNSTIATTEAVSICPEELPYTYHDTLFTVTTVIGTHNFVFHRTNAAGCDSTHTLILTVQNPKHTTASVGICPSQLPYSYYDTTFMAGTVSGSYTFHRPSVTNGCDSTHTLTLTIHQTYSTAIIDTMCKDSSYNFCGILLTTAGVYTYTLGSQYGCDSVITLTLREKSCVKCSCDTAYDHEGNMYTSVDLVGLCWFRRNMLTEYDSTAVGHGIPSLVYNSDMYNNEAENLARFGRLYNWETAQQICPVGWRLPTSAEYQILLQTYPSQDLKLSGPNYWLGETVNNSTTLSLVPSGYYDGSVPAFYQLYGDAYLWTSEEVSSSSGKGIHLLFDCDEMNIVTHLKGWGMSVRCVKSCNP